MSLAMLLIFILIIAFALYILRARLDPTLHSLIIALIVLLVVLWLLAAFHIITLPPQFQLKAG
jgi:hypothetical protein